ncbi:M15 family metallopeptidase [Streptomyces sp. NPDC057011]|uniref:M15 family metallopeptidase n=1 Tax=unclassified Streptomyces TaxID=2593676 RepID=UPI00363451F4
MGTPFDFFDPRSHTDSAAVSEAARANRRLLREALGVAGFVDFRVSGASVGSAWP